MTLVTDVSPCPVLLPGSKIAKYSKLYQSLGNALCNTPGALPMSVVQVCAVEVTLL